MNAGAQAELDAIRAELSAIIAELADISEGVRTEFAGIDSNKCADCLDSVLEHYKHVRNILNNINTEELAPEYLAAGGGSGALGAGAGGSR